MSLEFPYKPKIWMGLLTSLFCAAVAWVLFDLAQSNTEQVTVLWVVELSVTMSKVFYYFFAALSAVAVLAGLFMSWRGLVDRSRIVIEPMGLRMPGTLLKKKERFIPWFTMVSAEQMKISSVTFLNLRHAGGSLMVQRQMFRSKSEFERFCSEIDNRKGQFLRPNRTGH